MWAMREAAAQGQEPLCSPWHCGWGRYSSLWLSWAGQGRQTAGRSFGCIRGNLLILSLFFHYHLNSRDATVSFVRWLLLVTRNRLWWSVFREAQVSPWCSPLRCQHIWKIWIGRSGIHQGMLKICRFALWWEKTAPQSVLLPSLYWHKPSSSSRFPVPLRMMIYQYPRLKCLLWEKRMRDPSWEEDSTSTSHGHMDVGMEHFLEGLSTGSRDVRCGLWQSALMGTSSPP